LSGLRATRHDGLADRGHERIAPSPSRDDGRRAAGRPVPGCPRRRGTPRAAA
jgi:hypothetical protein